METIRAFIAVELPETTLKRLSLLQNILIKQTGISAKWVALGSIHLTLKFLGDITPAQADRIKAALDTAVKGFAPFSLGLSGLGVFPYPRKVQVIWAGIDGDVESLKRLQQSVEKEVSPLGFPTEARVFTPHLTLGRVRYRISESEERKLIEVLSAKDTAEPDTFIVDKVHLMRSRLTPQGALYNSLGTAVLSRA